jgi:hypothetical protein
MGTLGADRVREHWLDIQTRHVEAALWVQSLFDRSFWYIHQDLVVIKPANWVIPRPSVIASLFHTL